MRKQLWNVFIERVRGFWCSEVKHFAEMIRVVRGALDMETPKNIHRIISVVVYPNANSKGVKLLTDTNNVNTHKKLFANMPFICAVLILIL